MTKNLIVYFSASGVTKTVAQNLHQAIDSDIYEIKPEVPYTTADLDWMNKNSRSSIEMSNKSSRPKIVIENIDVQKYETIFLGFPIWWYIAPTIVNTFLESQVFANKKIVLFATSGGSGFGETVNYLRPSVASTCEIFQGKLFNKNTSNEELKKWANGY